MKKIRCAIYTRKSSEEGLDQEFNSLHAQREACAAYIASQKHEGWVALPEHYDDGGISGGTLERAGLTKLLQHVDDGLVDQIVVYKIDRLTRSLTDFAKLVDRLDAADASFVSVTQSFNTATSMGRLTLNVLLSFAQFEREVTAERIRDKIAASKKKGLWMGGSAPLGYEPDGRTLKIVEDQALTIRTLFDLYLEHGSIIAVKHEADRLGLRKKAREAEAQKPGAADQCPFDRGHVYYILSNPIYAGRIRHRNQTYEGQHPAIIDPAVFDDVQERLKETSGRARGQSQTGSRTSPLAGKLFDETGDRLTPSHANKKGRRYRYYVSRRMIIGEGSPDGSKGTGGWRLPAPALEQKLASAILTRLREHLPSDLLIDPSVEDIRRIRTLLDETAKSTTTRIQEIVLPCIQRSTISPGTIELQLGSEAIAKWLTISAEAINPGVLSFSSPFQFRKRGVETKLIIGTSTSTAPDATLIRNIAKAHQYYDAIKQGQTFEQIASAENLSNRRVHQVIALAFLAPDIIKAIMQGEQPVGLTAQWLAQNPMPTDWQEQRRIVATI